MKNRASADEDVSKLADEDVSDELAGHEESDDELDCIMYERNNFSQSAIKSLILTLDQEENLHPHLKKVLYLEVASTYYAKSLANTTWMKLEDDGKEGFFLSRGSGAVKKSAYTLPDRGYGIAVWKTKIIIAGGLILQPSCRKRLNSVFQYDTITKEWSELPPMKYERHKCPTLVPIEDRLFVFGGMHPVHHEPDKDIKLWGEYCPDLNFPEWEPFYKPPIIDVLDYGSFSYYTVYPKGNKILFCVQDVHIVSFDYINWEWHIYDVKEPVRDAPMWSSTVVVLDHFLFWHDHDIIYARDLSTPKHTTLPLYTFDNADQLFPPGDTGFYLSAFCNTFLHRTGNSELSLFWLAGERGFIWCQSFQIEISEGGGGATLYLVPGRCNKIKTDIFYIYEALEFKVFPNQ